MWWITFPLWPAGDAQRAAQQVLRTDAIPASVSAGAALHAAAQLLANCNSRAALAIFSGAPASCKRLLLSIGKKDVFHDQRT